MPVCSWDERQVAAWIVAFICDRCDAEGTIDLCQGHYDSWKYENTRFGCPKCHGLISYICQEINGASSVEVIN